MVKDGFNSITETDFPEFWVDGKFKFKLSYIFDPSDKNDGVTVHIPLAVLNKVNSKAFMYQIKGLRLELLTNVIKSLPKRLRKNLIPAPNYAKALEESLGNDFSLDLYQACAKELTRMGGQQVLESDFDKTLIDKHLLMNFSVEDENGKVIKTSRNFEALVASLQNEVKEVLTKVVKTHKVQAPTSNWTFGTIKLEQKTQHASLEVTAYPALTDKGNGVTLELYDNPYVQAQKMWQGQRKLIALSIKDPTSYLEQHLPNKSKLAMYYQPLGSVKDLINDLMLGAIDVLMHEYKAPVYDEASFNDLVFKIKGRLNDTALALCKIVDQILFKAHEIKKLLKGQLNLAVAYTYKDAASCLDKLVYKGFISSTSYEHLANIPRYLDALIYRLDKVHRDVNRDLLYTRKLEELNQLYKTTLNRYAHYSVPDALLEVKWLLEELKVSYFAQQLGCKISVSDKRIKNEIDKILKEYPEHN